MQNIIFLPLEKVFKIKPGWKAHSRNPGKKVGKKNFFSLCGYGVILENKKKEEEELHKLEWASRNEKRAHWNKNRSKGKKNTFLNQF